MYFSPFGTLMARCMIKLRVPYQLNGFQRTSLNQPRRHHASAAMRRSGQAKIHR